MTTMAEPYNPLCYGRRPRPACPLHGVEMVRRGARSRIVYWGCPVPDCACTAKDISTADFRRTRYYR